MENRVDIEAVVAIVAFGRRQDVWNERAHSVSFNELVGNREFH